jgi:glycosyltransferase involved in cell wall biosynthesis
LLFVGKAFVDKGGPDALRIFERIQTQIPGVRLLVAGPDRPTVEQKGVEWLGPLTREVLYESVYPQADVFLYPTRFDTAALVAQEALAHGVPVVAPRAMCMPDIVRHGETGYLFEPANIAEAASHCAALLLDSEVASRMRVAARADFETRLSARHRNAVLSQIYQALVK